MNRVKVSVSLDPTLLRAVDDFVEIHRGADRSKVIDQALGLWSAAQQDAAMQAQFAGTDEASSEREAWRAVRRAAATRRFRRS
jgi:metal-responsive CopG/Arc/MetJ family transcriptional regulator